MRTGSHGRVRAFLAPWYPPLAVALGMKPGNTVGDTGTQAPFRELRDTLAGPEFDHGSKASTGEGCGDSITCILAASSDHTTAFQPCRLVPFDGSSSRRQVGPTGNCTAAAWSPDGQWMYFTVVVHGSSHLWRQRFPRGEPQQLTNGPNEESQA